MDLASIHLHLAGSILKDALTVVSKPFCHLIIGFWIDMAKLAVINVAKDGHLFASNNLVGDAWIIRVDLESMLHDAVHEFPVAQQT